MRPRRNLYIVFVCARVNLGYITGLMLLLFLCRKNLSAEITRLKCAILLK